MKGLTPAKVVMMVFVLIGVLIVGFVVKRMMASEPPPPPVGSRVIPLPVGDLKPGTLITASHIGMGRWPENELQGDVLMSAEAIVGRIVKEPIKAAELIKGHMLYQPGELPPITVSDGHRAVTIPIAESSDLLEGLIRPGDHVDVHFTPDAMGNDPRMEHVGGLNMRLFKGVRVLAINRGFVQSPLTESRNSVTLEIAETDSAILRLAASKGVITLSFTPEASGIATVQLSNPDRATLEEILQLEPVPEEPAEPPPPPPFHTSVFRQSGVQTNTFFNGLPAHIHQYNRNHTQRNRGNKSGLQPPYPGYGNPGGNPGGANSGLPGPGLPGTGFNGGAGGAVSPPLQNFQGNFPGAPPNQERSGRQLNFTQNAGPARR